MRGWGALALVTMLLAPGAAAAWMALGGVEPSTAYDSAAWMFEEPDTRPGGARAYFQAFVSVDEVTVNPNVAAAESRVLAPGAVHHRALLGHWKDCNRDGYVGHAESALLDYSAALLTDTSVCPPTARGYNDGGWVTELIGIGMVDPCEYTAVEGTKTPECASVDEFHPNDRVLYANGTRVWADVGEPGALPPRECPAVPLPPATTSGTGMLLAYADCQDGRRVANAVNAIDEDGSLGLRFDDPEHPERGDSLLDVPFPVTLFGGESGPGVLEADSGSSAATLWDCSDPKAIKVDDSTGLLSSIVLEDPSRGPLTGPQPTIPVVGVLTIFADHDDDADTPGQRRVPLTDDEGSIVWAPAPAPAIGSGSAWDAAEQALDGPRGDCDDQTPSPLRPHAPGAIVEGGAPQVDEARKDRASFSFTFYDGHRGLNERVDFALGGTIPSDGGILLFRHGRGGVGPLWSADEDSVHEPQLVTRGSLAFTPAQHFTYYAHVGDDALTTVELPGAGATAKYGAEACGASTTGVVAGWVCDPALWWRDALGRDVRPRYVGVDEDGMPVSYGAIPGDRYHLRDVDCYDGHVTQGVFASAAILSDRVC